MPLDQLPVEFLFTLEATTAMSGMIPGGPQGTRVVIDASTGSFTGPKLSGKVVAPGGDWLTLRNDGTAQLDVRILLVTDDDIPILMTYKGIMRDGGASIRTAPQFETGAEQYAWLNGVQAVAIGKVIEGGVRYDVYALS